MNDRCETHDRCSLVGSIRKKAARIARIARTRRYDLQDEGRFTPVDPATPSTDGEHDQSDDSSLLLPEPDPSLAPLTVEEPVTRSAFVDDMSPTDDGFAQVCASPDPRGRPVLAVRWRLPIETPLRLCVHIHAFYIDVLPDLVRSMHVLPPSTPILISVQSQEDALEALTIIDVALGATWPRSVAVVPNRGRNFLPLFVTFANEIGEADLVLHLHTKKSLFCGAEQIGWRQHMTRALSDSPEALAAAVALFDQHPEAGLLMADPYPLLPVWASHWLGNQAHGLALLRRNQRRQTPLHPQRPDR